MSPGEKNSREGDKEQAQNEFPEGEALSPEEQEKGIVIEFPENGVRMPTQNLPNVLGRIEDDHPFRRPLGKAIIILGVFLLGYILFASITCDSGRQDSEVREQLTEMFNHPGSITYDGEILAGWFLDSEMQHFMAEDGRRFTYVDPHAREDSPVSGHWRQRE